MATVAEILENNVHHLSPVPPWEFGQTCSECFGPVAGFPRCYSCHNIFADAPRELSGKIVPMTIAVNPGPWYTRLMGYKSFSAKEYRPVVASVAFAYIQEHRVDIAKLLGGEPDFMVFTPSKGRHGTTSHPLRQAIELVNTQLYATQEPVRYVGDRSSPRGRYVPEDFEVDAATVDGSRVLVLEDLFVSGRTCISTAGAILEAGAKSVAIMPVAREVRFPPVMVTKDHPFFAGIQEPYDLTFWPRT